MKKYSLFLLMVVICLLIHLVTLPCYLNDRNYLYRDSGSALLSSSLFNRGVTPWIDFHYNYGFVTLWLDQLWFNAFGYTPISNVTLNLLISMLICWGIVEMIEVMKWNKTITCFVLLCLPYVFYISWFTTAHSLETGLIILCLVRFLRRSYASALFLATLALLVKPTLAYFAGMYLLLVMLTDHEGAPLHLYCKRLLLNILPALALLLAYSMFVLPIWGWQVYLESLFPFSGAADYRELQFGFFQRGELFWLPRKNDFAQNLSHYLLTPAGVWIAGTITLLYFYLLTLLNAFRTRSLTNQQRCILICGTFNLVFILILFGNEWSWTNATYLIILGTAACLSGLPRIPRLFLPAFVVFMVLSLFGLFQDSWDAWTKASMYADLQYLFATPSSHQELDQVKRLAANRRVLLLTRQGAPSLILGDVEGVPAWCLMPDAKNQERLAMLRQIDEADFIAIPMMMVDMIAWPEVAEHLKRFTVRRESDNLFYLTTPAFENELNHRFGALLKVK